MQWLFYMCALRAAKRPQGGSDKLRRCCCEPPTSATNRVLLRASVGAGVAGVVHACLATIGNLAVDQGVREAVVPCLAAVQHATQRHVANPLLVECCLKLFHCMSYNHKFITMRCVNTILMCLKQHPVQEAVVKWSLRILDNLAFDFANKVRAES
jgi:hypothetical protein